MPAAETPASIWSVCGGFLKLLKIPPDFEHRVVNIHPSLIPAFCGHGYYGQHVHQAVVDLGVKISGCTVHFVDNQYDHGPIILQRTVPVLDDDTADTLAKRVFAVERHAYPEALNLYAAGRLKVVERPVSIYSPKPAIEESHMLRKPLRIGLLLVLVLVASFLGFACTVLSPHIGSSAPIKPAVDVEATPLWKFGFVGDTHHGMHDDVAGRILNDSPPHRANSYCTWVIKSMKETPKTSGVRGIAGWPASIEYESYPPSEIMMQSPSISTVGRSPCDAGTRICRRLFIIFNIED